MSTHQDQVFEIEDLRKSMRTIGTAYQERSAAMIGLCRLFLEISPGRWDQVDALNSLVDAIDDAVKRAAAKAAAVRTNAANNAFAVAEERLIRYAMRYHPADKAVLGDPQDIMRVAAKADNDNMTPLGRRKSGISWQVESQVRKVRIRFQILRSPTDRSNSQTLAFELGTWVKITEVLWIFARLPVAKLRIAPKHVPHFYLSKDLPDRPLAYTERFRIEPLKDFRPENDSLILVLLDHPRTGRIFFECGTFYKTYTNIWKPHNSFILKDLQGNIQAAGRIGPMIQGEVRIWKRGTTQSPLELKEWTDVLDQAIHYPDVDWLIRTETSPSEAIAIEVTWERCTSVPRLPFQGAAPLFPDPLEPRALLQAIQRTTFSSSDSAVASNVVHSQSRTRTKDRLERQRQVIPPVPLASIRSSQSHDPPDVANVPHADATGASEVLVPLRNHSCPAEVTHSPGLDLENRHTSVPTSKRPFEGTPPRLPTAPSFVQTAYSPLERLALSIEDLITSTGGTLAPDASEMLTSWPDLERRLIQEDTPTHLPS